jgi:TPR repeat protein
MNKIASFYLSGTGVIKDEAEAYHYYSLAAAEVNEETK